MYFKLILTMSTTIKCSLNVSLSKDDMNILQEGIESPNCAGILYSCFQNLEKKENEIF